VRALRSSRTQTRTLAPPETRLSSARDTH